MIVHPSYDAHAESYDSDIAIAVLLRTIQFTNFIIPICMWTTTSSYNDIVGHKGFVAGNLNNPNIKLTIPKMNNF